MKARTYLDVTGFADGYQAVMLIAAELCVACGLISNTTIGRCVDVHTPHQPTSGCVLGSLPASQSDAAGEVA